MVSAVELEQVIDFKKHNKEVEEVWSSYEKGRPLRIPMILGLSSRYFMFNGAVNPNGVDYKEYTENPDVMFEFQVKFDHYRRMNIPADYEMGLPKDGWTVNIDFQNYYEAAWLGADIRYIDKNVPASEPFLKDDNKNLLFEKGIPGAFNGIMRRGRNYYEYFHKKAKEYLYEGIKVDKILPFGLGTDGPFTIACDIRGTTEFCLDLYEDPEYASKLLDFITDAIISRITQWRKYFGTDEKQERFYFADDSILLLSGEMYKEFVLPFHRKLVAALENGREGNGIHLCGDATRHFMTIRDELNVTEFDTGFPVKHGELVRQLGPDIRVNGGPHVELLRNAAEHEIDIEVKRIIDEVKDHTKKFVFREGNNLAPYTPIENITAMYNACRKYGRY